MGIRLWHMVPLPDVWEVEIVGAQGRVMSVIDYTRCPRCLGKFTVFEVLCHAQWCVPPQK